MDTEIMVDHDGVFWGGGVLPLRDRAVVRLTMDVFLGDILRPYERRQASNISFKHTFMHRKVLPGSDNGVFVIVIDDIRR